MFKSGGISFELRWAYMLIASGDWLAPVALWISVGLQGLEDELDARGSVD
ncbi:MAG: hypothetical protein NZ610_07970 [Candidatus Bipolaricaulota bacterium]|nr:hypothetical protein [Candidatus Bipolaricaulota bacterium]MCS7275313.1 hypothetical protein [Candidatus Bipolaricaulota bacterium]MDW8110188.1 hypothetical protein [Candidatus Bipolaricaulota bacterium]